MQQNKLIRLKVAIVHDILLELGGAERVLTELLDIFPHADFYTSLISPELANQLKKNHLVFSMKPNLWMIGPYMSSVLKPFILLYWKTLDLENYDLVITSSHSFSCKSINISNHKIHISYIHTPPKYLYSEFNEMNWTKKFPMKFFLWPMVKLLRYYDKKSAQTPTTIIVPSLAVQKRINKYYKRDSLVIYPPATKWRVDSGKRKNYFLFHSRLTKQKGLALVIETFNKNGEKLIIIGDGPELNKSKHIANANCSFLGRVDDSQLGSIYSGAKALVFAGLDEDFGLVMAEALSAGVPVIAYRSAATEEIVSDPKLGVLFDCYSVDSLSLAIETFKKRKFSCKYCINYAKRFSRINFRTNFTKLVLSYFP